MSEHKEVRFKDEDQDITISNFSGDVRLRFSFTSERLLITQPELKELIKALQAFEEELEE